jgi:hypothetical protein
VLQRPVGTDVQSFQKAVIKLQEVLEVHHIVGTLDYLVRVWPSRTWRATRPSMRRV